MTWENKGGEQKKMHTNLAFVFAFASCFSFCVEWKKRKLTVLFGVGFI